MNQMKTRRTARLQPHKVLRDIYRHYTEFKALVAATGEHVIDYNYLVYDKDGETVLERVVISISFYDLREAIADDTILSERKRQAVLLNVILDKKQKDVAEMMGITTVSVGQYVDQACLQLAETYFKDTFEQCNGCNNDFPHTVQGCPTKTQKPNDATAKRMPKQSK